MSKLLSTYLTSSEKKILAALVTCSLWPINSCVTTRHDSTVMAIPVVYQPMFRACAPIDREANLTISEDGSRIFGAAMVWSFPSPAHADIQLNSPLGDTITQFTRNGSHWTVSGADGVVISETSSGALSVGGYEIPIKSDEVGCILSGVWPANWLTDLDATVSSSASLSLSGKDNLRKIVLDINTATGTTQFRSDDIRSRVMLEWGGLFGFFRRSVLIERISSKGVISMQVSGVKSYLTKWTLVE